MGRLRPTRLDEDSPKTRIRRAFSDVNWHPDTSKPPAEQSPCFYAALPRDQLRPKLMRNASMARPTRKEFLKLELAGGLALALPFGVSGCSSGGQTGALLGAMKDVSAGGMFLT
jgi:hypothetical protein